MIEKILSNLKQEFFLINAEQRAAYELLAEKALRQRIDPLACVSFVLLLLENCYIMLYSYHGVRKIIHDDQLNQHIDQLWAYQAYLLAETDVDTIDDEDIPDLYSYLITLDDMDQIKQNPITSQEYYQVWQKTAQSAKNEIMLIQKHPLHSDPKRLINALQLSMRARVFINAASLTVKLPNNKVSRSTNTETQPFLPHFMHQALLMGLVLALATTTIVVALTFAPDTAKLMVKSAAWFAKHNHGYGIGWVGSTGANLSNLAITSIAGSAAIGIVGALSYHHGIKPALSDRRSETQKPKESILFI